MYKNLFILFFAGFLISGCANEVETREKEIFKTNKLILDVNNCREICNLEKIVISHFPSDPEEIELLQHDLYSKWRACAKLCKDCDSQQVADEVAESAAAGAVTGALAGEAIGMGLRMLR